ncbi:MAG: PD-(D/E)XK nuclease family protein, partial [bacterium]
YPYQVGALVAAPLCFILDLSQESTQPARLHFTGLPRELEDRDGGSSWSETGLLSALGASGAVYCHAESGLSGYSVPHPFLLSLAHSASTPQQEAPEPTAEELETAAWTAADPGLLPRAFPSWAMTGAARGCRAAAAIEAGTRNPRRSGLPLGPRPDSRILFALPACGAGPDFKFSPARLATIGRCPFRWFASCIPGLEVPFKDPLPSVEGSLTHDLIGTLLGRIAELDGRVVEAKTGEYLANFDRLFASSLEAVLRRNGPSLRIALELTQPRLASRIAVLLSTEAAFEEDGWDIGEFEIPLAASYPDHGIRLEGRADRVASMRDADGEPLAALIDYKKNKTPARKEFLVDESGKLADCQLAAYASILDSQGARMGAALYWSVETCRPLTVFGPGGERTDWDSFAPERKALESALAEASAILREGRFMDARPGTATCQDCGYRAICRAHFSSERP